MKIKIQLNQKLIFKIIIVFIFIINSIVWFFLYQFLKKYVYDTVYFKFEKNYLTAKKDEDINMQRFKMITEKIEKKQTPINWQKLNNIFY